MKHFTIYEPVWKIKLMFIWNTDDEGFAAFMRKRFDIDTTGNLSGDGCFMKLKHANGADTAIIALSGAEFTSTADQHETLAHESFHFAMNMLKARGLKYNKGSEEAYAYLIGWAVNTCTAKALAYEKRISERE